MTESDNGQRQLSDSDEQGEQIMNAVREAIRDWVEADEVPVRRDEDEIIAEEDALVKNISVMVALAMDEAAE